jgi:hypothetical protein
MEIPNITDDKRGKAIVGEVYEIFGMKLQVVEDSDKVNKDSMLPMMGTVAGCIHCALRELCNTCQHKTGLDASFMPCADSKNFNNRHFVKVEE